nr:sphingomyelin phosphodiesterase 4 [Onthophagus taurus]
MWKMNALDSDTFLNQVSLALNNPIHNRCSDLTVLLESASVKDLQHLFPLLIDNIFGPQGTVAWGLRTITANLKPYDFHALQNFFSPMGPMFKVIYTLIKDPLIKYDFSITYLPMKIRQLLDAGSVHPFYSDLVHVSPQNKQIVSLLLNPFDYYMFHFAYHLINPWHQRNDLPLGSTWNSVYYILCCDYVLHFFPTQPIQVQPPVGIGGKLTSNQPSAFSQQLSSPSQIPTKLLRKDFFNDPVAEFKLHPPLDKHPRAEIWRSESVLIIFLDMWLNNDQISQPQESFNMNLSAKRSLHFNEVPAGEYVRIIRILVKQLHAFSASQKIDDGHMVELKKITLPIMQGKMYVFLRNLIHRWPLDGSFRLVLELWLSFIQPWRYAVISQPKKLKNKLPSDLNLDSDEGQANSTKGVDKEYLPFIAENILAYVVIFQQLLPRFLRVDLSSPKNSLMLYRLAKVFDQPNLVSFIKEIENCIEENYSTSNHGFSSYNISNSMPPLSPTAQWSSNRSHLPSHIGSITDDAKLISMEKDRIIGSKYVIIVKQKMYELEGTNFCYKPLFISPPAPEVYDLLNHILKARITAVEIIDHRNAELKRRRSGIFGFLKQLFSSDDFLGDEFSLEDRKKVPGYLDFASQYLCDMFSINEAILNETIRSLNTTTKPPIIEDENNFPKLLTPEKVRERIYKMKFEGDPDLQAIRSDEVTLLVKMFYDCASKINENYGYKIKSFYEDPTYIGKIARQIISPPITIYKYDKSNYAQPRRIAERLPPRISLRFFASYKFLVYMSLGVLISTLFHYSIPTFIFFVFSFWFCWICIKALFDKTEIVRTPNLFDNLSFDQSF